MRYLVLVLAVAATACSQTATPPAGGCASDNDCERPLSCLVGACRQAICEPGARQCNETDLEVCSPDGQGFVFNRACAAGCDPLRAVGGIHHWSPYAFHCDFVTIAVMTEGPPGCQISRQRDISNRRRSIQSPYCRATVSVSALARVRRARRLCI